MKRSVRVAFAGIAALSLFVAACGGSDDEAAEEVTEETTAEATEEAPAEETCTTPTPVKLQLQWFTQAQFAGYYAAVDQGFYNDQCLDVSIVEGGVDIVPQTELANGNVDFAISWVS
ncbi:MAG: ABC transporter substrate-binding protein, partial [Acidimicrobiia bacterium]|nr:ABC transporter substrate-binding protein [Acidimicrobiia bacterium]